MKKGIHPETYRLVAFKDMSNDQVFITRSCANTKETIEIEGVEYPVVKLEISSSSHPFYTGKMKLVDTAGRVDKFYQRYAKNNFFRDIKVIKEVVESECSWPPFFILCLTAMESLEQRSANGL